MIIYADLEERLAQSWRWGHYTTEHGLPAKQAFNIIETPSGYIWACMPKGIAWFDGYLWNQVQDTSFSIPHIYQVSPGIADDLFLTMDFKVYNVNKTGVRQIEFTYGAKKLSVFDIVVYNENELLIHHLDSSTNRSQLYKVQGGKVSKFDTPGQYNFSYHGKHSLVKTKDGTVWYNADKGIFRLNNGKWKLVLASANNKLIGMSDINTNKKGEGIISISFPNEMRGFWAISKNKPPEKLNVKGKTFLTTIDFMPDGTGFGIYNDGNISVFRDGRLTMLKRQIPELMDALCYAVSRNGDLYVGTVDGISLCRLSSEQMNYLKTESIYREDLLHSNYVINEILIRDNGEKWFATGAGLFYETPEGEIKSFDKIGDLIHPNITALNEDKDGNIWIGSGGFFKGAYRWDGEVWERFGQKNGFTDGNVHKIFKDRNYNLWFTTISGDSQDKGFGAYKLNREGFHKFTADSILDDSRVYSFLESSDGALWFGTYTRLIRYKNGLLRVWKNEDGVWPGGVFSIIEAPDRKIWLANRYRGVAYIENDQVKSVPALDSLNIYNVWELEFDNTERLWISTTYGLYSYKNGIVSSFDRKSGLNTMRLWPMKTLGDKLYIGTSGGGVNILNIKNSDYKKPLIKIKEPASKESSVFLQWEVYSYMGQCIQKHIDVRYKIDNGEWSNWDHIRQVSISGLSIGEHVFTIQAKNMVGGYDPDGEHISFIVPRPFIYSLGFLIPMAIIVIGGILFAALYVRYKNKVRLSSALADKNSQIEQFNTELSYQNMLITDQKEELTKLFEEVLKNERKLREANATKDKFFSILAHDLKNPLQGLLTISDLLVNYRNKYDEETLEKHHKTIYKTTHRLVNLLESLLQWSRNQLGKIEYKPQKTELRKALNDNLHIMEIYSQKKRIKLLNNISEEALAYVDPDMINSVFRNLISNAIKFTPEKGKVSVSADINKKWITVSVEDTGIGIDEEDIGKLFRIDIQHSTLGTNSEKGTGLGLNLCKDFIEFHGGAIWVESEKGKGSSFKFKIPKFS